MDVACDGSVLVASAEAVRIEEELNFQKQSLARIIHIFEDNKSLLCYKHVDKTMFAATKEASECLTIAQHSVCCSREFFASLSWLSSISARGVPTAEPCC